MNFPGGFFCGLQGAQFYVHLKEVFGGRIMDMGKILYR